MVSNKLRLKYPDKVPVVIKKDKSSKKLTDIGTIKYLVQDHITVGQFIYILRKRIELSPEEALYLYANINNSKSQYVLSANDEMITIYNNYKNEKDCILHLVYAGENVFG